jgi:DNA-directed RNA polymerase sigma subunit (sigma70/sigma32)
VIDDAVARLPERQREIVERTFGFDAPPQPIAAVAADLHLSPQRTRTIAIDALHRLRDALEEFAPLAVSVIGFLLAGDVNV